jgi:hypothetical protein
MSELVYLPTWLAGVVVVGVWTALAGVGVALARPVVQARLGERHHDVVVPLFLTTATMYAVVVAFMVVIVWQRYSDAGTADLRESTVLVTLYRETLGIPEPLAGSLRADLRAYTAAVIDQELPAQRRGETSAAAQGSLDRLFGRSVGRPSQQGDLPEVYQEFLSNLSTLAELRAARVLTSRSNLPGILTFGLVAGGVLTIANSTLFVMQRRALQIVAAALMGAMIGVLLFVILVLNQPYAGDVALGPGDYQYAQGVFQAVDSGRRPVTGTAAPAEGAALRS